LIDLHSEHARGAPAGGGINLKEKVMLSEVSISSSHEDLELDAYNAAFYELGSDGFGNPRAGDCREKDAVRCSQCDVHGACRHFDWAQALENST